MRSILLLEIRTVHGLTCLEMYALRGYVLRALKKKLKKSKGKNKRPIELSWQQA